MRSFKKIIVILIAGVVLIATSSTPSTAGQVIEEKTIAFEKADFKEIALFLDGKYHRDFDAHGNFIGERISFSWPKGHYPRQMDILIEKNLNFVLASNGYNQHSFTTLVALYAVEKIVLTKVKSNLWKKKYKKELRIITFITVEGLEVEINNFGAIEVSNMGEGPLDKK